MGTTTLKTLYLLRHAKSSWRDPDLDDYDRPLNKRGKRAAKAMRRFIESAGIQPDLVLCSGAKRARDTLAKVGPALHDRVKVNIEKRLHEISYEMLLRRLGLVDAKVGSLMVIGHNPVLHELAMDLVGSGDPMLIKRLEANLPTGALAVLEVPIERWRELRPDVARLMSLVLPRDLEPREDQPGTEEDADDDGETKDDDGSSLRTH